MKLVTSWSAFKTKLTSIFKPLQPEPEPTSEPESFLVTKLEVPFDPIVWSNPSICKLKEPDTDSLSGNSQISHSSIESSVLTPSSSSPLSVSRTNSLASSSRLISIMKHHPSSSHTSRSMSKDKHLTYPPPSKIRYSTGLLDIKFDFEEKHRRCLSSYTSPVSTMLNDTLSINSHKTLRFKPDVLVYETYGSDIYPRDPHEDPELSPKECKRLNKEMRRYKLKEMVVHPSSVKYTSLVV